MIIEATYSPEDNALRLYASARLDDETYAEVKDAGFKWAPKQELFVVHKWTPKREDLCIKLAGSIEPEQTTMIERAEAKIERLETAQANAERRANTFHDAASTLAEAFAYGQPILVGHHSERKARKTQERVHSNMKKAVQERKKIDHFQWKAMGVAWHANRKNSTRTRLNRIKTLLAELRDLQRTINHAQLVLKHWERVKTIEDGEERNTTIRQMAGGRIETGDLAPWPWYQKLDNNEVTHEQFVEDVIKNYTAILGSEYRARWIIHTLNRLAYERGELGDVKRFEGDITPAVLQVFTRTHGAHKPKATNTENGWKVESAVQLPAHIGKGVETLELTDDEWRDLMQASGYDVPEKKAKAAPILNFKAESISCVRYGNQLVYPQMEMTKAEYSELREERRWVEKSECGQFRFKVCLDPEDFSYSAARFAVFLIDSKVHDMPESLSINPGAEANA